MIAGTQGVSHRTFNPLFAEVSSDVAGARLAGTAAWEGLVDQDGWM